MLGYTKSLTPASPELLQLEELDKLCIEVDRIEERTLEELTQELTNLYGQIPSSPAPHSDADLLLA